MPLNVPNLDDHIAVGGGRPFVWGVNDCSLFAADWVRSRTGLDPASDWRGAYTTMRTAHRLLADRGGLLAVISNAMDGLGFARTDDPLSGDVGVVTVPTAIRRGKIVTSDVAAIRVGRLWAVKARRGMAAGEFPCLAAWSISSED